MAVLDNGPQMPNALDPFRFLPIAVNGRMNERQLLAIDFRRPENRVLREQLGRRRLRFNDDHRRRLPFAVRANGRNQQLLS